MRILLVDDEVAICEVVRDALADLGFDVSHAQTIAVALALMKTADFDVAILDVYLADGLVYELADQLERAGCPFFFASTLPPDDLPPHHQDRLFLPKPYGIRHLLEALEALSGNQLRAAIPPRAQAHLRATHASAAGLAL